MIELVVIGGSAGSFRPVTEILRNLRPDLAFPVVFILHRLKNINEGFEDILNSFDPYHRVFEPCDKEIMLNNKVYLAPANYHLLFTNRNSFCLCNDETYMYSKPSIDLAFISASICYKKNVLGIILSGANRDGANGLSTILKHGGDIMIQDIEESEVPTMPFEAAKRSGSQRFSKTEDIWKYINDLAVASRKDAQLAENMKA